LHAWRTGQPSLLHFGIKMSISVLLANVVHDVYRHLWRDVSRAKEIKSSLRGVRWGAAVVESSFVRMFSELGRVVGILERGEYAQIGRRFDWFVRRAGDGPMNEEKTNSAQRMSLAILFLSAAYIAL